MRVRRHGWFLMKCVSNRELQKFLLFLFVSLQPKKMIEYEEVLALDVASGTNFGGLVSVSGDSFSICPGLFYAVDGDSMCGTTL